MSKSLILFISILVIIAIIIAIKFWNKDQDEKWNQKCRISGGKVIESGKICDYKDCDRTKFSCEMSDIHV